MSSDFDFSQFKAFASNFHKTLQEENFIFDVMNRLGNMMITDVKNLTPVGQYDDTVYFVCGGKLLVFESDKPRGRQGGNLRRNWILDGVTRTGDGYVVTISNNTEYAGYVENGHRIVGGGWVEGQFFLKITMEEIMSKLPAIVGPMYENYLRQFGVD